MKRILAAVAVVILCHGTAYSQTSSFWVSTPCGNCTSWCDNCAGVTIGADHVTGCDSNERTPTESLDCKLAYWQKETEKLQKQRDEVDGKLTKAKERTDAFKAAGAHAPSK
jgi:hypothetical protein